MKNRLIGAAVLALVGGIAVAATGAVTASAVTSSKVVLVGLNEFNIVPGKQASPAGKATFVLKNSHTDELAFNMDRGWGINIFAYSGKPPKAKSIVMFPKHCTTACSLDEAEKCPVCPEPEKVKDIKAAQKMEKVAAGETLEVPWDGQALVYSKTRGAASGKSKKCECHAPEAPADGEYTVKACGLRLTTEVGKNSQLQCVEGKMTLPVSEPIKVELDFGAPPKAPCKKGKKC